MRRGDGSTLRGEKSLLPSPFGVPFRASRTDIFPEVPAASPGTSTSSAGATGEVGSSPSDYSQQVSGIHSIDGRSGLKGKESTRFPTRPQTVRLLDCDHKTYHLGGSLLVPQLRS